MAALTSTIRDGRVTNHLTVKQGAVGQDLTITCEDANDTTNDFYAVLRRFDDDKQGLVHASDIPLSINASGEITFTLDKLSLTDPHVYILTIKEVKSDGSEILHPTNTDLLLNVKPDPDNAPSDYDDVQKDLEMVRKGQLKHIATAKAHVVDRPTTTTFTDVAGKSVTAEQDDIFWVMDERRIVRYDPNDANADANGYVGLKGKAAGLDSDNRLTEPPRERVYPSEYGFGSGETASTNYSALEEARKLGVSKKVLIAIANGEFKIDDHLLMNNGEPGIVGGGPGVTTLARDEGAALLYPRSKWMAIRDMAFTQNATSADYNTGTEAIFWISTGDGTTQTGYDSMTFERLHFHDSYRQAIASFNATKDMRILFSTFEDLGRAACVIQGAHYPLMLGNTAINTGDDCYAMNGPSIDGRIIANYAELAGALHDASPAAAKLHGRAIVIALNNFRDSRVGIFFKAPSSPFEGYANSMGAARRIISVGNNVLGLDEAKTSGAGNACVLFDNGHELKISDQNHDATKANGKMGSALWFEDVGLVETSNCLHSGNIKGDTGVCREWISRGDRFQFFSKYDFWADNSQIGVGSMRADKWRFKDMQWEGVSPVFLRPSNNLHDKVVIDGMTITRSGVILGYLSGDLLAGETITSIPLESTNERIKYDLGTAYHLWGGEKLLLHDVDPDRNRSQVVTVASETLVGAGSVPVNSVTLNHDFTQTNTIVYVDWQPGTHRAIVAMQDNEHINEMIVRNVRTEGDAPSDIQLARQIGTITGTLIDRLVYEDDRIFTATFSGDGATTEFRTSDPLDIIHDGYDIMASAGSADAASLTWAEYDDASNEVVFHFSSAPASGTDNVKVSYQMRYEGAWS